MAQHDYVIANGTGAAVRSDLNNALAAIVSQNSGATAPSTTYAYQWWADTTTGLLKLRNAANNAWITLFQLDGEWSTLAVENGSAAAPSIYFKDSGTDTGIYSPGTDQVAISTGGTGRLFVNASGNVGLGTSSIRGTSLLDARGDISFGSNATYYGLLSYNAATGHIETTSSDGGFKWIRQSGPATSMTLDSSGRLGIGNNAPIGILSAKAATNGNIHFRDIATVVGSGTGVAIDVLNDAATTVQDLAIRGATTIFRNSSGETARLTSNGQFLVGTSSARSNLFGGSIATAFQVEGTTAATSLISVVSDRADNGGGGIALGHQRSGTVGGNTILQNGDYLGLVSFQGSDGTNLLTGAEIGAFIDGTPGSNDLPSRLVFSTTADGSASPTERMRINAAGVLMLNTTSLFDGAYAFNLGVSGATGGLIIQPSASGTYTPIRFNNSSGTQVGTIVSTTSSTAYNTSSDYRLKENVVPLTGAADRLNQLKAHRFNFIADPDKTVDGFIAHEAQAVVPECVTGTKDEVDADGNPKYQGIDQSKLVPLLTAALQEALAEIESLKARVTALEP